MRLIFKLIMHRYVSSGLWTSSSDATGRVAVACTPLPFVRSEGPGVPAESPLIPFVIGVPTLVAGPGVDGIDGPVNAGARGNAGRDAPGVMADVELNRGCKATGACSSS